MPVFTRKRAFFLHFLGFCNHFAIAVKMSKIGLRKLDEKLQDFYFDKILPKKCKYNICLRKCLRKLLPTGKGHTPKVIYSIFICLIFTLIYFCLYLADSLQNIIFIVEFLYFLCYNTNATSIKENLSLLSKGVLYPSVMAITVSSIGSYTVPLLLPQGIAKLKSHSRNGILQVPFRKGGTFLMLACCFIGHRNIEVTDALSNCVRTIVLDLINKGVEIFYFGSRSRFNDLCYEVVSDLRNEHPNIQRIFVRAEYQYVNRDYINYLLQYYEDTFYPSQVDGSGKIAYVKRNQLMIDASDYCVFYFNPNYTLPIKKSKYGLPTKVPRSGTRLAYDYALSKAKIIHNVFTGELTT